MHKPELSIVIPFCNEADCLVSVCREVDQVLTSCYPGQWELVMVNDGSTDGTPERMNALAARDERFRAVHLTPNSGQSAALQAGFRAARGAIIGTMDGDGQNDPRDFPRLIAAMHWQRVDMMCGIRRKRSDNRIRRISSRIANRVRSAVLKDGVTDIGCAMRVFRRQCLDGIWFFRNAHRFFPALFQMAGYSVAEMPVSHRDRLAGESRYGGGVRSRLFAGLFDLVGVYWMKKRFIHCQTSTYRHSDPHMEEMPPKEFIHEIRA